MKVLITGSRTWTDKEAIRRELMKLPIGSILVHGDCKTGADAIAESLSIELGFETRKYPADWDTHGKKAGPIRNGSMLRKEHMSGDPIAFGLAFTENLRRSRGTADMVTKARARGVRMEVISE